MPMRSVPTSTLVAKVKRQAKQWAKTSGQSYVQLLDVAAREAGYSSFHELQRAHSANSLETIPLDPPLPNNFDHTPNEERPRAQLDAWWDKPFAVSLADGRYEVRCLDGGAWDRSTWYGVADSLQSAAKLGAEKLRRWRHFRSAPIVSIGEDGKLTVVRMPQRPDAVDVEVLYSASDSADAARWIQDNRDQDAASSSAETSNSESENEAGSATIGSR